jgi:hypothetical protein
VIPRKNLAWDHYSGIRALILQNLWRDQYMQKYRGIGMGRRKINNNEIEVEGSGDDHEPQGLALLVTKI